MQVHGMQCPHPGWPQKHLRRSHAHRHPEKDETYRQEEAGQFFLLTHLIDLHLPHFKIVDIEPRDPRGSQRGPQPKQRDEGGVIKYQIIIFFSPQMKYLAAYALLALGGKKDITANDVKSLLGSIGSHATDEDIKRVIDSLKGKSLHQLIADGQKRIGSAGPATAATTAPAAKKEAPKKQQPKKKEAPKPKEPEPAAEEEMDMGDLFG